MNRQINGWARALGMAGLLPLAGVVAALLAGLPPGIRVAALSIGHGYAALILSFLGGLWWGLGAAAGRPPRWLWVAAVMPSLIAFAPLVLIALGEATVGTGLVITGVALVLALLVDQRLEMLRLAPPWWLGLRMPLSLGLGSLSLVAAALA
ncbi:DUF3429 domain-containing protein [Polymorphobacter sp.]|uniref:DUF3429 domain-containing protein n=1 Tax=Polymorphobacter sp. TaxID=1909290 RepID=UPI003F72ED37